MESAHFALAFVFRPSIKISYEGTGVVSPGFLRYPMRSNLTGFCVGDILSLGYIEC